MANQSDAGSSSGNYDLLDRLAEEFADRFRRGERPSLKEYTDRYPDLADEIQALFPAMVDLEQADEARQGAPEETSGAALPRPAPTLSQVGDYRVLREIGHGGMGVVYEAEQVSLGRRVAVKILPQHVARDVKMLERFRREARAAARLHHTNIVPVFEVGREGDVCYYAMQFIQGQGLDLVYEELRRLRGRARARSAGQPTSQVRVQDPAAGTSTHAERAEVAQVVQSLLTGRFGDDSQAGWRGAGLRAGREMTDGGSAGAGPATVDLRASSALEDAVALARTEADAAAGARGSGSIVGVQAQDLASSTVSAVMPGGSQISTVESGRREYAQSIALIGLQAAQGLAYAHARGVLHRDVKPSNLLLDTTGVVWITDFGLAKADDDGLTQSGDILGTLRYMAPERFSGNADARADVYALGLTLYELLTLEPAFEAPDRLRLIEQIKSVDPVQPRSHDRRIPRDLETVILKAIDKDPRRRYQTADELAEDLRRFRDDEPVLARRTTAVERYARWARHNPGVAVLGGVLTAVLVLATAVSLVVAGRMATLAERQRRAAESERVARLAESMARAHESALRKQAEQAHRDAEAALTETRVERQRAEENFQRARAAVDQYFTQVSESQLLTVPGLQTLRRDLLNSALAFYEDYLASRGRDPGLRAALAAVHLKAARIHQELGNRAAAEKDYRVALRLYEDLTRADPVDVESRNGLAECHYGLAAYEPIGKPRRDALERSAAIRQELVATRPADTRLREDLARSYQALGESHLSGKQVKEGLASFLKARDIVASLVGDHMDYPAYRYDFAQNLAQIAECLCKLGRHPDESVIRPMAIGHARAAYEQAPQLVAYGRLYGHLLMREGDNLGSQGRYEEAARSLQQAVELEEKLIRENPAVPDLAHELVWTYTEMVGNLSPERRATESVPLLRQACARIEAIPLHGPDQRAALAELLAMRAARSEPSQPRAEDEARRRRDLDEAAEALRQAFAGGFQGIGTLRNRARSYFPALLERNDVKEMLARAEREAQAKADAPAEEANLATAPMPASTTAPAAGTTRPADPAATAAAHQRLQADLAASQHAIALIHVGMGKALMDKVDLDGALVEMREAQRLRPEDPSVRQELEGALKAVQNRDAVRLEAAALKPDDFAGQLAIGHRLRTLNDLEGAATAFRAAIRIQPDAPQAHTALGLVLYRQGDLDGAVAGFREAVRLKSDEAYTHDWLGFLLNAKGDRDAAIVEFREALRLDPGFGQAHRNLGQALLAKGDTAGGTAELRAAVRLRPEDSSTRKQLAAVLRGAGDQAGADALLREAQTLDESARHVALARKLQEKKDLRGAIAEYRLAVGANPANAEAHFLLADALRQIGELDAAMNEYHTAIKLEPKRGAPHNNLGLALERKGDLEAAIAEFRAAIQIDRGASAVQHGNLARVLMARDDLDGAIAEYREALRLQPKNGATRNALGLALVKRGDHDEALALFQAADPAPGAALVEYASVLRRAGKRALAVAAAREATDEAPGSAQAYQTLASILLGQLDWAEAAAAYREAIQLKADDPVTHHELGVALSSLQNWDEAIASFREAHRLRPDFAPSLDRLLSALAARRERDRALAGGTSQASGVDPDLAALVDTLLGPLKDKIHPDEGIVILDALIRDHPDHARLRLARARALIEVGRKSEAAVDFAQALARVPENPDRWATDDRDGVYPAAAADAEVFERLTALRPGDRTLWVARVRHFAARREWPEAAAVAARLNALDPPDNFSWHHEAVLHAISGDHEAYRRVCQGMLERFAGTSNALAARRTVLSSLLEPGALPDLTALDTLVTRFSASAGSSENPWSILAAGFLAYRTGRFRAAVERLAPLPDNGATTSADQAIRGLACVIRAMAFRQLDESDEARRQLAAADALARSVNFDADRAGPLPFYWNDWLRYRILRREAEELLRAPAAPADPGRGHGAIRRLQGGGDSRSQSTVPA
jgi:tetratricopeptide (TPR) repeat protein/serine/threonine protein kinase